MLPQRDFKETVMRRVRMVFVVRSLIVPTILELVTVAAFAGAFIFFVSLRNVALNFKRTLSDGSVLEYIYEAVMHTELFVQLVMAGGILASGYFVYRIVRAFRTVSFSGDTVQA